MCASLYALDTGTAVHSPSRSGFQRYTVRSAEAITVFVEFVRQRVQRGPQLTTVSSSISLSPTRPTSEPRCHMQTKGEEPTGATSCDCPVRILHLCCAI
jgi:hypothetical protein